MSIGFYKVADIFFFSFHTLLILFNTFGWIFKRVRFYNLITLLLTVFSWFILGIWYGWGYCFCTDWHWAVREQLGYIDQTNSYIDLLVTKLTGMSFSKILVDTFAVSILVSSLILSILFNVRDYKKNS